MAQPEIFRKEPGGGAARLMARMSYTSGGLKAATELGNGVVDSRGYDRKERLVQIKAMKAATVLTRFDYSYDERNNRTQVSLGHFNTTAKFAFDPNGNRLFKATSQVGLRTYQHDEENRLIRECKSTEGDLALTPAALTVDSTFAGFAKDPIVDGKKSPLIKPGKAWKSADTAGQHFVEIALGQPTLVNQITLWFPFRSSGRDAEEDCELPGDLVRRFRIQVLVDGEFEDVAIEDLQGARPTTAAPGWLRTRHFKNVITFTGVLTEKIRFLQDANGGCEETPEIAAISEISLRGFGGADGCIVYEYDANGNQIRRTEGNVVESFAYDYANRLAAYTRRRAGGIRENFAYLFAATGERMAKRDVKRNESTFFMYDGPDIAADYTMRPNDGFRVQTGYTNGPTIDSKIARIDPADGNKRHFYLGDALGSVNALADEDAKVRNEQLTNAWGEDLVLKQRIADRYGFTQRERDGESSLMHFRARSYDPRSGRFAQRDPLTRDPFLADAFVSVAYTYVKNRPVFSVDPLGLWDIKRDKKSEIALAIAEEGDTLASLAEKAELDDSEIAQWLSVYEESSKTFKPFTDKVTRDLLSQKVKAGTTYGIPNSSYVFMGPPKLNEGTLASELVSRKRVLGSTMQFESNIFKLKMEKQGFFVNVSTGGDRFKVDLKFNEVRKAMEDGGKSRKLTGFFIMTHGSKDAIFFHNEKEEPKDLAPVSIREYIGYGVSRAWFVVCDCYQNRLRGAASSRGRVFAPKGSINPTDWDKLEEILPDKPSDVVPKK